MGVVAASQARGLLELVSCSESGKLNPVTVVALSPGVVHWKYS